MLNKHYKLAIIIAAHKSADKIRIVLDSISRQAGFNQIQIIVKDSGNDNNIKKIIDSYLKLDIKLIISSDCGIYDAWNQALDNIYIFEITIIIIEYKILNNEYSLINIVKF